MTTTKLTAQELAQRGYRRISGKYHIVARIDRPDWVLHLAAHLGRAPADLFIVHAQGEHGINYKADSKVSGGWCDYYRRCLSQDIHTVPDAEVFRAVPGSGHDNIGYVDPVTLREAAHIGWP
jgi:hypothetical protein